MRHCYAVLVISTLYLVCTFGGEQQGKAYDIELNVPKFIDSLFFSKPEAPKRTEQRIDKPQNKNKYKSKDHTFKLSLASPLRSYLKLFSPTRRQEKQRVMVEMGTGVIKPAILTYPKDKYKQDLLRLIRIQEREKRLRNKG